MLPQDKAVARCWGTSTSSMSEWPVDWLRYRHSRLSIPFGWGVTVGRMAITKNPTESAESWPCLHNVYGTFYHTCQTKVDAATAIGDKPLQILLDMLKELAGIAQVHMLARMRTGACTRVEWEHDGRTNYVLEVRPQTTESSTADTTKQPLFLVPCCKQGPAIGNNRNVGCGQNNGHDKMVVCNWILSRFEPVG